MNGSKRLAVLGLGAIVLVSGCATTRAKKVNEKAEMAGQIQAMQNEIQAKDQQIMDLQAQLDSAQVSSYDSSNYASKKSSKGSSYIRVAGVSVKDVQKALSRAGFDPGPIDGRWGKKTKAAVKSFQRRHNLRADGVVGQRTWARLQ